MGKLTEWMFGTGPQPLTGIGIEPYSGAKSGMPKPPPLDTTLSSLWTYSKRTELVYACIEKKAQAACDAVLMVEKRVSDKEWAPIDSHPLVNLMNKPNIWDDGESFIRSWVASENFSDNFYCEIVRSAAGIPVGLYPLNPVYLVPQYFMGDVGWYIGFYYYYSNNGYPVRLEVDDLLIRRRHGLGSIYSDVSAVQIALGSIDADAALTDYVRAFFNNGGAPSGILINKGRKLSDADATAMQQKWTQRYSRGGTNRNGVAIIDSEQAEYQPVGSKMNELHSEALNIKAETRICMAFGVPPILIGAFAGLKHITQNATAKAAMGDFWMHTMSPELKAMRTFLTWNLLPMFENIEAIKAGKIRVNWDMSQVMALQEDIDAVHSRVGEGFQNGIYSLDEARSKVGLDPVATGMGDKFVWELNAQKAIPGAASQDVAGNDPNAKPPPKQLSDMNTKDDMLDAELLEPSQKKTFEFDGLALSREPTPLEMLCDLKSMVTDHAADRVKLTVVLMQLRDSLITEAENVVQSLPDNELYTLTLTPPASIYKRIVKIVTDSLKRGQSQIVRELIAQGAAIDAVITQATDAVYANTVNQLSDFTVSRVVNEVQTRAINQAATFGVLGVPVAEVYNRIGPALRDQSDKWVDSYSGAAVNAAAMEGRSIEMEAHKDEIGQYEYSAILDANTCEPCADADGLQAATEDGLPDAPNPDCDGGDRCRCFIIAIYEEQAA